MNAELCYTFIAGNITLGQLCPGPDNISSLAPEPGLCSVSPAADPPWPLSPGRPLCSLLAWFSLHSLLGRGPGVRAADHRYRDSLSQ